MHCSVACHCKKYKCELTAGKSMVKCHCEKIAFCLTLAFTSAEYLTIVVFKCSPLIEWIKWQGSVIVSKFDFFVIILYNKIMLLYNEENFCIFRAVSCCQINEKLLLYINMYVHSLGSTFSCLHI